MSKFGRNYKYIFTDCEVLWNRPLAGQDCIRHMQQHKCQAHNSLKELDVNDFGYHLAAKSKSNYF